MNKQHTETKEQQELQPYTNISFYIEEDDVQGGWEVISYDQNDKYRFHGQFEEYEQAEQRIKSIINNLRNK